MDKDDVAHIYNGILLNHKSDGTVLFAKTWMDLETVIQSEASQKEKNKYCILTHIFGIQKPGADEPICRAAIDTDTENGLVATVGKE